MRQNVALKRRERDDAMEIGLDFKLSGHPAHGEVPQPEFLHAELRGPVGIGGAHALVILVLP
jgi:hypothetical protein